MFQIQVLTDQGWQSVRPSGKNALPYEYETRFEAEGVLSACYPDQARDARLDADYHYEGKSSAGVRVVEIKE